MRYESKEVERQNKLRQWHKFFVLVPRKIGNTWVWLETIYRRRHQEYSTPTRFDFWDYTWEK